MLFFEIWWLSLEYLSWGVVGWKILGWELGEQKIKQKIRYLYIKIYYICAVAMQGLRVDATCWGCTGKDTGISEGQGANESGGTGEGQGQNEG